MTKASAEGRNEQSLYYVAMLMKIPKIGSYRIFCSKYFLIIPKPGKKLINTKSNRFRH